MQRLRIRYAKRGRLRFASHRDFSRAFERAVVRARLPMAYSSGYHPHPRISYAGAAPTGSASEAEYLEIGLARVADPEEVLAELAAAMPDGLDLLAVVESGGGPLADRLQASRWRVDLAVPGRVGAHAVREFLGHDSVMVTRMTKKGMREFDCRAAVASLTVSPAGPGSRLDLVLRHTEPMVRPDDVVSGLGLVADLDAAAPPLLTRLAQGPWDPETATVGDPLG